MLENCHVYIRVYVCIYIHENFDGNCQNGGRHDTWPHYKLMKVVRSWVFNNVDKKEMWMTMQSFKTSSTCLDWIKRSKTKNGAQNQSPFYELSRTNSDSNQDLIYTFFLITKSYLWLNLCALVKLMTFFIISHSIKGQKRVNLGYMKS